MITRLTRHISRSKKTYKIFLTLFKNREYENTSNLKKIIGTVCRGGSVPLYKSLSIPPETHARLWEQPADLRYHRKISGATGIHRQNTIEKNQFDNNK